MEFLEAVAAKYPQLLTEVGFSISFENEPFMRLVVENIGGWESPKGWPSVSIAHWGEQNGDAMRDPEMCFHVPPETLRPFIPFSWRNDYLGVNQQSMWREDDAVKIHINLNNEHQNFAGTWNRNLRDQGFFDLLAAGRGVVLT